MKLCNLSGGRRPFFFTAAITCANLLTGWATAHEGDRVVPILEITDDMLAQIDLRDGTTDEWYGLLGEPTLKTIDFKTSERYSTNYDPADLDFAIWLGWHEELDRIYYAGAFFDNAHWGTGHPPFGIYWNQDRIQLYVDGDHSGRTIDANIAEDGRYRLENQTYGAVPWISEGPNVILPWVTPTPEGLEPLGDWMIQPPFCDAGGNVIGEQPTIWIIEFFVTPFDLLVALEPDESVVSDLKAGEVIGLGVGVWDKDGADRPYQAVYFLGGLFDALLLSYDQVDRAVRDRTWGRIKAALDLDR